MHVPLPRLHGRTVAPLLAGVLASSALLAPAAHADGVPAGATGLSEKRLRALETSVLGKAHASEHSVARRELRRWRRTRAAATRLRAKRPRARTAAALPLDQGGRWNGRFTLPVMAIHSAMLPTGKVLFFAYPKEPDSGDGSKPPESWAALWNPANGSFKRVDPPINPDTGRPANIWCGGQSFLADGRLLVTGGTLDYSSAESFYTGLNRVYTFNPFNETWTEQPRMGHGRWYPSQMLMPDGRTFIMQGLNEVPKGGANYDLELFTPSASLDGVGTITKFGAINGTGNPPRGDYYPHLFWMPSGRGLVAGQNLLDSWFLNPPGNPARLSWTDAPNPSMTRRYGSAVLLAGTTNGSTKVMQMGGGSTSALSTKTTEMFDEANAGAGWQSQSALNIQRGHLNTVLLPDGSMVTVGGGLGNGTPSDGGPGRQWGAEAHHRQVELWDPATKTWKLGPEQLEKRAYHSVAMLLPDGRVWSAGDDRNGGYDTDTAELYEPAYLFKGTRPTITSAPSQARWGATFGVQTPNADVTKAVLVAPSAVTHATDMNQRMVPLALTKAQGGVNLAAPPNANVAPPGYYMLFLLNDKGAPSVARWVRIHGGAPDTAPLPGTGTGPTPPGTAATLTVAPGADARVEQANPTTNYARSGLKVDGDPATESFLKFTVPALTGPVRTAKLRVYAWTATTNGPAAYATTATWTEPAVTWNTRPARTTGVLGDAANVPTNSWVEYDVTTHVKGAGTYSFVLTGTSGDGVDLRQRESTIKPQLVVTTG